MNAANKLYGLWAEVRKEDNSIDYINELCEQIKLFGTETNSLTKSIVLEKLENICVSIRKSLEN